MDRLYRQCVVSLVALIVVSLSSCMSFPEQQDIQRNFEFSEPSDIVWEGIMHYLASNEIPIQTLEKDRGIVHAEKTDQLSRKDDKFAECPHKLIDLVGTRDRLMKVNIFVSTLKPDTTTVTIDLKFSKVYFSTGVLRKRGTTKILDCVSTGIGEQAIYESILKYVAGATGEVDSPEK